MKVAVDQIQCFAHDVYLMFFSARRSLDSHCLSLPVECGPSTFGVLETRLVYLVIRIL